ncbi:MAG: protein translocase subunit SecF [Candidatus Woesearchaeota archaeon]|nr:MAG: protein translocase subunit SecF [Candidatus Woesearchaeota archaeon]
MAQTRRERQKAKFKKSSLRKQFSQVKVLEKKESFSPPKSFFGKIYYHHYKTLLILPLLMLLISFVVIGMKFATTGEVINRGVSLKGGVTVTIPMSSYDLQVIESSLQSQFPGTDLLVRGMEEFGTPKGVLVTADIPTSEANRFIDALSIETGVDKEDFEIRTTAPSLGSAFFHQTFKALLIAFVFMSVVVFLYFRSPIPSLAVILAALSDIVITLAVVDFIGLKLSTAGIAAFLMLIGYSVDTDILLSTRVLKRKELGTVYERIIGAMKTGMTMTLTTLIAVFLAMVFTTSVDLQQIMIIVFIGLLVDIINTWIQNAGILRWYMERQK